MNITDVTDVYLKNATPCKGILSYEEGYYAANHRNEIIIAGWLHDIFGGNIKLLNESQFDSVKTPDYIWNDKYWELKSVSSLNSVDKLLQHAIKQIKLNPGGVIMDLLSDIALNKVENQAYKRIFRSHITNMDLIIIRKGVLIKILRYKK